MVGIIVSKSLTVMVNSSQNGVPQVQGMDNLMVQVAVAVDSSDNVYVVDRNNARIQVFTPSSSDS